jgi:hypothetical protein
MLSNSITKEEIIHAKRLYDTYKILLSSDLENNHLGRHKFHPYPVRHRNEMNTKEQPIRTLGKISEFLPDYSIS